MFEMNFKNLIHIQTPFYYYDLGLLRDTLDTLRAAAGDVSVHYALKANSDRRILSMIQAAGLGADCVSEGEIHAAFDAGFKMSDIVFAGVGKTDREIAYALRAGIGCLNVESEAELEVIDEIAGMVGRRARVALRVNPHVDAMTAPGITTGLAENKFGIDRAMVAEIIRRSGRYANTDIIGLHFHIGSQITDMKPFVELCAAANDIVAEARAVGADISMVNLGGGLGVDYRYPLTNPVPDFKQYFDVIRSNIDVGDGVSLHVELGRSVVAQCGALVTSVLYIKEGINRTFAIVDAGMNNLVRPAMYGSYHDIVLLDGNGAVEHADGVLRPYDIVGPVCESSDTFCKERPMPVLSRGDRLAILSAGAYGQSMSSDYNMRPKAPTVYNNSK